MFIVFVILLFAVTVFILENRSPIPIRFLSWDYTAETGLALIGAALVGAIVMYLSSFLKQRELRGQARAAESKLRDLERQHRQAERQPASGEGQPASHP